MKKIRAAIIGLGKNSPGKGGAHSISYAHAEAYKRCKDIELIAGVSRNQKNVDDFCAEYPCAGYTDYKEMLAAETPDLVSICAFPPDREAMASAALECGACGLWIEKPFAVDLTTAKRVMDVAEAKNCRLFVNHQRRYGKPFEWFRDAVRQGKIGSLMSIDINMPGRNFIDFGPHLIDASLFAMGPERYPVRICGAADFSEPGLYQGVKTEKHLLGSVVFNDGCRLGVETEYAEKQLPILRAQGSTGFAELHLEPVSAEGSVFRALYEGETSPISPWTNEHFHHSEDSALYVSRAADDIAKAMKTGASTRIDVSEAWRGMVLMMKMVESAEMQKVIRMDL